ncbi:MULTISPECIES: hypothetical protein [Acidovorax]|uniref:Replication protein n=1 Tax=Acidovorax facilis TaxID=12917 RepID=A0ABV8DHP6_9BURK|nr:MULTISPECIES: hypothetical protein [Acidovorax]MBO1011099.1 hypothetical protein [Acidovorax sp. SD340]MCO4245121.1 hypothetical protein [Acidovorax facilis]
MKFNITAIRQHEASKLLTKNFLETGKNILGDGLKLCQRAKAHHTQNPGTAFIVVEKKAIKEKINGKWQTNVYTLSRMHDTAQCGNAHLCPHCTSYKAAHMRGWIELELLPAAKSGNLCLGLLTLTARHRRDCDWSAYVKNFYSALGLFSISMDRAFKKIGYLGRLRTLESPVGNHGIHPHIHDLFTYAPGTDLAKFQEIALKYWKKALKKVGLDCNNHGINIKPEGKFDPLYVAKEMAAYDTKTGDTDDKEDSKNKNLFQLLDASAKGDTQAANDWIRAAKAIQGRDRWNVGQLAQKLGIPCPSEWKKPEGIAKVDPQRLLISYPQPQHMIATSPSNPRAGLAFILRAARNEAARPGTTQRMVLRMCDETIKADVEQIKVRYAKTLAKLIKSSFTSEEKERLCAKIHSHCTFAIAEYRATTYSYMHPAPKPAQQVVDDYSDLIPDLELDFS